MAEINTSINIRYQDGSLIKLNEKIIATMPVASQPSIIDEVVSNFGNGFLTGDITKQVKRAQIDSKAAAAMGGVGGFVGASSQHLHKVFIGKVYREDNIVYNETDLIKLKEGKGGDIVAKEAGNFIITGRELDLKLLLADLKAKATAGKLHTAFDANGAPTGAQPADGDGTFAQALTALKGGRRVLEITNFDEKPETRLDLLVNSIAYLNTLGTDKNLTESAYAFSINGHDLSNIKILTTYMDGRSIKSTDTTNFISVNSQTERNIVGLVGYIDNKVKVLYTNQIPANTRYVVLTDRAFARDLDTTTQYIGTVRDAAAVVMKDDKAYNLKPNERLVQFYQGRRQGVVFHEEAFFLDQK